jgi:PIN like domain
MAGVLRNAGLKVEVHDDHFAQNAPDPEWLTAAGEKDWIVTHASSFLPKAHAEAFAPRSKNGSEIAGPADMDGKPEA